MSDQRHVKQFRNARDGDRREFEPVRQRGLVALLQSMAPLTEDFPEISDPVPTPLRESAE